MEAIDLITNRKINLNKRGVHRVAIKYDGDELVYGYTRHSRYFRTMIFFQKEGWSYSELAIIENFPKSFYCSWEDLYYCEVNIPLNTLVNKKFKLPTNIFPYSFQRRYEAVENFDLFCDKQLKTKEIDFPIANVFKYTFGLEFETSMGAIPEVDCFRTGLIPLRDGSISGIEYATVKLEGIEGFNLLSKQLEVLRKYTHFNKDCSLHVHLGGFPLDKDKLWNLYRIIYKLTDEISILVPIWSFNTGRFKSNGKDYCKKLPKCKTFNELFKYVTGRNFLGSFVQPHPNDITRERKWQIPQRYHMCNFVNMFCYNINKTIEMRFLSPTFNMEKILTWLYIFNAILVYAENYDYTGEEYLLDIFKLVYPQEYQQMLNLQYQKLCTLVQNQERNGDHYGADVYLENRIFDENGVI